MFQISIFLPDWLCHSTRNDPRKNVSINDFILKSSHNLHEYDFKVTKIQKHHPFNEMDDSLYILCLFCTYWIWDCPTLQICIWLQINATKLCKKRINASRHNMSHNFNHIISNIHYYLFYINILGNIYLLYTISTYPAALAQLDSRLSLDRLSAVLPVSSTDRRSWLHIQVVCY